MVDDGSTDDTAGVLAAVGAREPRVRTVVQEGRGQFLALIAGARAARGEVILLLDDDVVPAPGIALGHARHHAERDDLVVVGHMPVTPAPTTPRTWPRDIYARSYDDFVCDWEAAPGTVLDGLWGGHVSVRREHLLAVEDQLADASLGYHRDVDFGLCLLELGLTGRFDRSLGSRHELERTAGAFWANGASSGVSTAEVQLRHPGALPSPPLAPLAPELLRSLALRPRGRPAAHAAVRLAMALTGTVHAYELQRRFAGLGWRILQAHGYAARSAQLGLARP